MLARTYHARDRAIQRTDWVVEQWCNAMRRYSINPVYPPTEDFHVGDIIGFSSDPSTDTDGDAACPLFASVKVAYVPMAQALEEYYRNVAIFPETATPPKEESDLWRQLPAGSKCHAQTCEEPASGAQSVFQASGAMTKLPIVAFPGFSLDKKSNENLGASIPLRIATFVVGESGSANDAVSIKIRSAETYGVPAGVALQALLKYCDSGEFTSIDCWNSIVAQELASLRGKAPKQTNLSLVYRVYLIRSIEYTLSAQSDIGAEAKALLEQIPAKKAKVDATEQAASDTAENAPNSSQPEGESEQKARRRISELMTNITGKSVPGGTFTATATSNGSVTLIETFERPIAVGYRSVSILSLQH
jgi:hypothetical protein